MSIKKKKSPKKINGGGYKFDNLQPPTNRVGKIKGSIYQLIFQIEINQINIINWSTYYILTFDRLC